MMKKYIITAALSIIFLQAFSQSSFQIKLKLHDFEPSHKPMLYYMTAGKRVLDTTFKFVDGVITFEGAVSEPTVATMILRNNPNSGIPMGDNRRYPQPALTFVLGNELTVLEGDANKLYMAEVKKGKLNLNIIQDKARIDALEDEQYNLSLKASQNGTLRINSHNDIERDSAITKAISQAKLDFISRHPGSIYSAYLVSELSLVADYEKLSELYNKLDKNLRVNSYVTALEKRLKEMEATSTGKLAPSINRNDLSGKLVHLEDFKGKYILIDFWGSWCNPCRASHPHLKSLYSKYKSSGFEILGIAQERFSELERNRAAWKKAIADDGLEWIQVMNNEGVEQYDIVKAYGVMVYPTKFLLDTNGKIIARYVGEDTGLDATLKKIFKF